MSPEELDAWALDHITKHSVTFGWDWEADLAFARATEADESVIKMMHAAVHGMGPATFVAYHTPMWKQIKADRLKVLGRLTKAGKLTASWAGMPASVTGGATRTRAWTLTGASR